MSSSGVVGRVTTRGYYDRRTGGVLRARRYSVYPPNMLNMLAGSPEISIMVHGMRNDSAGAASKVSIASERLAHLGYVHPVIGFSYDSDVVGAHLRRGYVRALGVARAIAEKNGFHLAAFLEDFARSHGTAVRLLGHSLGSEVIVSAVRHLHRGGHFPPIRSVHLFAASATRAEIASARHMLDGAVSDTIKNYYHESDEELARGHDSGLNPYPAGLCGTGFDDEKFQNIPVSPENHRFASYAAVLGSFP